MARTSTMNKKLANRVAKFQFLSATALQNISSLYIPKR